MEKLITPKDVAIFLETATKEELLEMAVLLYKFRKYGDLTYDKEKDLKNFSPGILSIIISKISDYLEDEQGYEYVGSGYVKRAV